MVAKPGSMIRVSFFESHIKLVIEKTVSGNGNAGPSAGFHYEIENVGYSAYIDTSKAGNPLKVIA